jgi:very-short-patch-repair endonuclease
LASEQATIPLTEAQRVPEKTEPIFEEAPDLPDDEIVRQEKLEPTQPQSRLDKWQRKLLDLSLRNSLLNFRTTKRAIKFEAPIPGLIEDMLADGQTLKILPDPKLMEGLDLRSQAIHENRTKEDLQREHALDALTRNELLVHLSESEMESRLVELYRFARATLQEGGANTLFLALGFLSWTKDEKDEKRYKAPLILIPVTLNRRSVRSGFFLKLHDDEPRFNPTLLEMLRQDFKLELHVAQGELPKDEHGLDIDGIWKAVAHAVKDIRGWEVSEDIVLSTFSFAKYLMWKDLVDRTDQLKQNPVVKHLIDTPRDPYKSGLDFPNPRTLDQTYGPEQIFCPLPADSSQLSSVIAAVNGKDFVMIGPPGTGKSQTIANLIAQCLAEQKTVLFVSEKIVALNVVYRRLKEVGLGDFCLELHSNKARKLDVLTNLGRAWEAKGEVDAEEWKKEAERLKELRDHLNSFVKQMHLKRRNGLTAYRAIGIKVAGKDFPKIGLSWPSPDIHDEDSLFKLRKLVEDLDIIAVQVGSIAESPLALISHCDWSPHWTQEMISVSQAVIPAVEAIEQKAFGFQKAVGLPQLRLDENKREGLRKLSQILPDAAGWDYRFTLKPDSRTITEGLRAGLSLLTQYEMTISELSPVWTQDTCKRIRHGLELIDKHAEVASQLSAPYADNGKSLAVEQFKEDWEKAENTWWPKSWFGRKKVSSALSEIVNGKHKLDLPSDLERMVELRKIEAEISDLADLDEKTAGLWKGFGTDFPTIQEALEFQSEISKVHGKEGWPLKDYALVRSGVCGEVLSADLERIHKLKAFVAEIEKLDHLQVKTSGLWAGLNTNTADVEKALEFQTLLSEAITQLGDTLESLSEIKSPIERLLGEGNTLLEATGTVSIAGKEYREALDRYLTTQESFVSISGTPSEVTFPTTGDLPENFALGCRGILELEPKLKAWCAWRKIRGEAISLGLAPLVKAVENGSVRLGTLIKVFDTDYARWWLNAVVDGDEVLRTFVSATHEKRIADFRALDEKFTDLTRQYVRAGLCSNIPDQDDVTRNSEWGLLKREMQKKKRHIPLREMVSCIPSALTKLAPCLMMSPLSIAQYLSTDTAPFDIVVFDEASQIPVWDAIGAIARGKQVVMVGDPKQLPPTSFFDRAEADGDEDADIEPDLESILDECLGANLPTQNLSWHYRSRHESLIAFSNNRYYGGGLITFPSPVTDDRAVSFQLVRDGVYEKGGARINKPEAKALVKHIITRLKNQDFKTSGLTIGVVTFNSEQQKLIEDLLDDERRKSPSIERYFSENLTEPIFVKNLESVQGDERDIMYFSITYGPDPAGKVSMNFGPMNQDGGDRRLNVAVTRSRHELLVFSSLNPEQIDLSRTQAAGVRDLKHFMEFAERGPKAMAEAIYGTIGDYDSPFEQSVAEALGRKGWQVHPQVGVSNFRIDIGVVDPDLPGRYLAGVECDGATYHRSATARDRDKLREQVLRGLGWKILRIWSTDWWVDAEGALEKVHIALELLLEESRRSREEAEKKENASRSAESDYSDNEDIAFQDMVSPQTAGSEPPEHNAEQEGSFLVQHEDSSFAPVEGQPLYAKSLSLQSPKKSSTPFAPYIEYSGPLFGDPREINIGDVTDGLCRIIEVEGPMLAKRAYDIYLRGCGIKRMGRELKSTMNKALHGAKRQGLILVEDELKTNGLVRSFVRSKDAPEIKLRERGPRSFEEIPPSEILIASHIALTKHGCTKGSDDHLHTILGLFDLKRLTAQTGSQLLKILALELESVRNFLNNN